MNPPAMLRFPLSLLALVLVMAATSAHAATITVALDGGPIYNPVTNPADVIQPLAQGESVTVFVYLDLEASEVASLFEEHYDLVTSGSWDVTLDPTTTGTTSEVNPGISPFGIGTWPNTTGNLTSTQANVSLTSNNLGGERLVTKLDITRLSNDADDLFEVYWGDHLVYYDVTAGVDSVDVDTPRGARLFSTIPEPGTAALLGAGLTLLGAVGRRRRT